jgi:hypothetical protein
VAICPTLVFAVLLGDVRDDRSRRSMQKSTSKSGMRHALGVQEALEEQAVGERIEVGDAHRVRDERAGAGAAARPHRDAVLLGVGDEVPHDEEVPGELHLADDVELDLEARR